MNQQPQTQAPKRLGVDIRIGGSDPRMDAFADHLRSIFPEACVTRWTLPCNVVAGSNSIDLQSMWEQWSVTLAS
jgi:hypothetical protein